MTAAEVFPAEFQDAIRREEWENVARIKGTARGLFAIVCMHIDVVESVRACEASEGGGAHRSGTLVVDHQELWPLSGEDLTRAIYRLAVDGRIDEHIREWRKGFDRAAAFVEAHRDPMRGFDPVI